jgi:DNA polymerase
LKHLHLDIESRSCADLRKVGVHEYARDPTTDVWCACYGFKVGEIKTWLPDQPCPPEIVDHVAQGGTLRIWNSQFERVMWTNILGPRYGWPMPALEQFECVMAKAYALALPGSLEDAGAALGMAVQKDKDGKRLMLQMSRPRRSKDGSLRWWDEPEKIQRLAAYCVRDVEAELVIDELLLDLQPSEKKVFLLNQKANDLGVYIDRPLAQAALDVVDKSKLKMDGEMQRLTGGEVPACTNAGALVRWLNAQGVETDSVDKASISKLLAAPDFNPSVRQALELRQEAAKSSTAKVEVLLNRSATDGWVRGNEQYHGAATGRFCLAEVTLIRVLRNGDVMDIPIEAVSRDDNVWDGDAWVPHEGVVFSGDKEVMTWDGVCATAEHQVYVSDNVKIALRDAQVHNIPLFTGRTRCPTPST